MKKPPEGGLMGMDWTSCRPDVARVDRLRRSHFGQQPPMKLAGEAAMECTLDNGLAVIIDGRQVVRISRLPASSGLQTPLSRIDMEGGQIVRCREAAGHLADQVKREQPSLVSLQSSSGQTIWVDAVRAVGPIWIPLVRRLKGVASAVVIEGRLQYLENAHQEVADVLRAAGGTPSRWPVGPYSLLEKMAAEIRNVIAPHPAWE